MIRKYLIEDDKFLTRSGTELPARDTDTAFVPLEAGTGFSAKKPGLDLNIISLGNKFKVCSSRDSLNRQHFGQTLIFFPTKYIYKSFF
jgi:hypothetical protein